MLFLSIFMYGCGSEFDAVKNKEDSKAEDDSSLNQSQALDTVSDLPECVKKIKKQLVYVRDEEQFYVCEDEWEVIDISTLPAKSSKVAVEEEDTINSWVDAVSEIKWLLGGSGNFSQATDACSGKYRLPSKDEATSAVLHGIRTAAEKLGVGKDFWTSSVVNATTTEYMSAYANGSPRAVNSANSNSAMGVFCVKK